MTDALSLKDFISKTILDLCEAVEEVREKKFYVAPRIFTDPNSKEKATDVEFDIAVSVSNSTTNSAEGNGAFSISVLSMNISAGAAQSEGADMSNSSISRIKFNVPVYFQFDKEERDKILGTKHSCIMKTLKN
jgi:hypothetical protein